MRSGGLRNAASYAAERMLEQCESLYGAVVAGTRVRR
jgi:hypothetical protein